MKVKRMFINKVLLEHGHAYLCIAHDCFCATVAKLQSCNRNFTLQPFTENVCQSLILDMDPRKTMVISIWLPGK